MAKGKLNRNRTKIVCTLGPSSSDEDTLRDMIDAGMDVARINMSHGTHEGHEQVITLVRRLAYEAGHAVAVMADLQGPKIRIGKIEDEPLMLHEGSEVTITSDADRKGDDVIYVPHADLIDGLRVDGHVWLDDGLMELRVVKKEKDSVRTQVMIGGPLVSSKGISAPGVELDIESITAKDRVDIRFAIEHKTDYIAMSFVRTADDLQRLRHLIEDMEGDIPIVAKIERREALNNIQAIVQAADAIMIARGDLGVETPVEEVPVHQKNIIRVCNYAGRPVITATQMLNSMMLNPRPTRAESSDVFNAILDGTDAVMLSGETAVGEFPVRSVETMKRIVTIAEENFPYDSWDVDLEAEHGNAISIPEAIGLATCQIAAQVDAKAIITSTRTGYTARQVAKHRPRTPIICTTPSAVTRRRMALVWGVEPVIVAEFQHTDEMIANIVEAVTRRGLIEQGDFVVITAGIPVLHRSQTNLLNVHRVGLDDDLTVPDE